MRKTKVCGDDEFTEWPEGTTAPEPVGQGEGLAMFRFYRDGKRYGFTRRYDHMTARSLPPRHLARLYAAKYGLLVEYSVLAPTAWEQVRPA